MSVQTSVLWRRILIWCACVWFTVQRSTVTTLHSATSDVFMFNCVQLVESVLFPSGWHLCIAALGLVKTRAMHMPSIGTCAGSTHKRRDGFLEFLPNSFPSTVCLALGCNTLRMLAICKPKTNDWRWLYPFEINLLFPYDIQAVSRYSERFKCSTFKW